MDWKPLVKMMLVEKFYLVIKVWETLFYLLGEFDAGASWVYSMTTLEFLEGFSIVSLECSLVFTKCSQHMRSCSFDVAQSSLWSSWLEDVWLY